MGLLLRKLFGPRHVGLKLGVLIVAVLALFFTYADGDYRVTADARLEGTVQRAIAVPMAGYVVDANVRAGDIVKPGDMLFSLDDRDLRLERLKWAQPEAAEQPRTQRGGRQARPRQGAHPVGADRAGRCRNRAARRTIETHPRRRRRSTVSSSPAISVSRWARRSNAAMSCSNWRRSTPIASS